MNKPAKLPTIDEPQESRIEWGILDTCDALSPAYDYPQTEQTVAGWFQRAGLVDVRVRLGGNGVLGNGRISFA
ncbi:MAG: hypothetical protein AB7R40_07870 [Nitrospiraceae bacterium]